MTKLKLQPSIQAQWFELVQEAHRDANVTLSDELKSYLISLLMRFIEQADLVDSVLAVEYLEGQQHVGQARRACLRDVGDKCLLFSGLFPGRARRVRVRVSHFVDIGQSAYSALSDVTEQAGLSDLFRALSYQFVPLMDVLHVMGQYARETPELTAIEAYDLWVDTHSKQAKRCLAYYSSVEPLIFSDHHPKFRS